MAVFNRQYILRNQERDQIIAIFAPGRPGLKTIIMQGSKQIGNYKFLYEKESEGSIRFMLLNRKDEYAFPGGAYSMYDLNGDWFGVLRGFMGEILWVRFDDDPMPRRFLRIRDKNVRLYREEK